MPSLPPAPAPMTSWTGGVAEALADAILATYRFCGLALSPLVPFALARRARRGKEDRDRTGERYGHASARAPPAASSGSMPPASARPTRSCR